MVPRTGYAVLEFKPPPRIFMFYTKIAIANKEFFKKFRDPDMIRIAIINIKSTVSWAKKKSSKSVNDFVGNLADRQTVKETDRPR